jgi:hypothetical protein
MLDKKKNISSIDLDSFRDIILLALNGKKLLYKNSQSFNDAKIIDIEPVEYFDKGARVVLVLEQPFKNGVRKHRVAVLDDDRLTIAEK